jgi:phosphate starvation-inducible PhoH-like protein
MKESFQIDDALIPTLLGKNDEHLKMIKKALNVDFAVRGSQITIIGAEENVSKGRYLIKNMITVAQNRQIGKSDVNDAIRMIMDNENSQISEVLTDKIIVPGRAKTIIPKSEKQKFYLESINKHDIVFGIGPAGTGKTYLAMAMAVNFYLNKKVSRIILTRPAVEAGEKLGFLPGDIADKINPYLKPLYDALYDMIGPDKALRLIDKGVIELAPLAFMRGRTLNDAFIILDEAQNCTLEQMKMFLTRLGYSSKAVITGDVTQIDLPSDKESGLVLVQKILKKINGIEFVFFNKVDVVRHKLVQDIIKAYETYENKQ